MHSILLKSNTDVIDNFYPGLSIVHCQNPTKLTRSQLIASLLENDQVYQNALNLCTSCFAVNQLSDLCEFALSYDNLSLFFHVCNFYDDTIEVVHLSDEYKERSLCHNPSGHNKDQDKNTLINYDKEDASKNSISHQNNHTQQSNGDKRIDTVIEELRDAIIARRISYQATEASSETSADGRKSTVFAQPILDVWLRSMWALDLHASSCDAITTRIASLEGHIDPKEQGIQHQLGHIQIEDISLLVDAKRCLEVALEPTLSSETESNVPPCLTFGATRSNTSDVDKDKDSIQIPLHKVWVLILLAEVFCCHPVADACMYRLKRLLAQEPVDDELLSVLFNDQWSTAVRAEVLHKLRQYAKGLRIIDPFAQAPRAQRREKEDAAQSFHTPDSIREMERVSQRQQREHPNTTSTGTTGRLQHISSSSFSMSKDYTTDGYYSDTSSDEERSSIAVDESVMTSSRSSVNSRSLAEIQGLEYITRRVPKSIAVTPTFRRSLFTPDSGRTTLASSAEHTPMEGEPSPRQLPKAARPFASSNGSPHIDAIHYRAAPVVPQTHVHVEMKKKEEVKEKEREVVSHHNKEEEEEGFKEAAFTTPAAADRNKNEKAKGVMSAQKQKMRALYSTPMIEPPRGRSPTAAGRAPEKARPPKSVTLSCPETSSVATHLQTKYTARISSDTDSPHTHHTPSTSTTPTAESGRALASARVKHKLHADKLKKGDKEVAASVTKSRLKTIALEASMARVGYGSTLAPSGENNANTPSYAKATTTSSIHNAEHQYWSPSHYITPKHKKKSNSSERNHIGTSTILARSSSTDVQEARRRAADRVKQRRQKQKSEEKKAMHDLFEKREEIWKKRDEKIAKFLEKSKHTPKNKIDTTRSTNKSRRSTSVDSAVREDLLHERLFNSTVNTSPLVDSPWAVSDSRPIDYSTSMMGMYANAYLEGGQELPSWLDPAEAGGLTEEKQYWQSAVCITPSASKNNGHVRQLFAPSAVNLDEVAADDVQWTVVTDKEDREEGTPASVTTTLLEMDSLEYGEVSTQKVGISRATHAITNNIASTSADEHEDSQNMSRVDLCQALFRSTTSPDSSILDESFEATATTPTITPSRAHATYESSYAAFPPQQMSPNASFSIHASSNSRSYKEKVYIRVLRAWDLHEGVLGSCYPYAVLDWGKLGKQSTQVEHNTTQPFFSTCLAFHSPVVQDDASRELLSLMDDHGDNQVLWKDGTCVDVLAPVLKVGVFTQHRTLSDTIIGTADVDAMALMRNRDNAYSFDIFDAYGKRAGAVELQFELH